MLKTELKRAFTSKPFGATMAITFVMLVTGSSEYFLPMPGQTIFIPHAWWTIYIAAFYCSQRAIISLFYPIIAVIPYVISYRKERDSGYRQLLVIKSNGGKYLAAKFFAVAGSTFTSFLIPAIAWIPCCKLLGVTDPAYDSIAHMVHFAKGVYERHPEIYAVAYAFYFAILGTVFAVLALGLSAIIRNRYLPLILPFAFCVFSSSILDALIGPYMAAFDLLTFQGYYFTEQNPLGYWTAPVYIGILLAVGVVLFIIGDRHAIKA